MPFISLFAASFIVAILATVILIFVIVRALANSSYSFSDLVFNPKMVLSLISQNLAKD
jgi:hypothetical protein